MYFDPMFFAAASGAVILIGLSKGGFSGLSNLAMPLLSLVMSPVRGAAILLPIMIVQDWVSIWAFRKDYERRNLVIMIPAAIAGIGVGWLLAARVSESYVRFVVGLISVGFVIVMLVRDRLLKAEPATAKIGPGIFWGAVAGFTSMVSHSGGPPFMVYVMPQRLAPRTFAGTGTMFFASVNMLKVIPYFALGQFSTGNLGVSVVMLPVAVASTLAGVWLVRRVTAERFYALILGLTFIIGAKLCYDSLVDWTA